MRCIFLHVNSIPEHWASLNADFNEKCSIHHLQIFLERKINYGVILSGIYSRIFTRIDSLLRKWLCNLYLLWNLYIIFVGCADSTRINGQFPLNKRKDFLTEPNDSSATVMYRMGLEYIFSHLSLCYSNIYIYVLLRDFSSFHITLLHL